MKQRTDGRWEQKVTINGKRKAFYSTAKTERSAKSDINQQILEYTKSKSGECPFNKIAAEWSDYHCNTIPYTTWLKCYRSSYEDVVEYFKDTPISEITALECNKFLQYFISKKLSQKKISTLKSVVSMIMDYAIISDLINYNPMKTLKLPAGLPKTPRKIPDDECINIVKSHWQGEDFLPYFLLYSGLRISEAIALTDEDIDLERKIIKVNKAVVHCNNTPILKPRTKTDAGMREIILLDRLAERMPKFKGLLFCNNQNTHLTKAQLKCWWNRYRARHNIPTTAHQLRHAYATMLFEAGIDVKTAQTLMGHADIHMTMDIYADIRQRQIEGARDKLNSFDF